jgi:hypothetical protein
VLFIYRFAQKAVCVHFELFIYRFAQKAVCVHFVLLVLLWFTLEPEFVPGWGHFFRPGLVLMLDCGHYYNNIYHYLNLNHLLPCCLISFVHLYKNIWVDPTQSLINQTQTLDRWLPVYFIYLFYLKFLLVIKINIYN